MRFEAVIFDCDGVLVDSEALGLEVSAEYLRGHGFTWSEADLVRLFTGYRDDVFAEKLAIAYCDLHGRMPEPGFFEGLVDARRSLRRLLQPVSGAREAVAAIEITKAVASSSREAILHSKMKRTGMFDFFDPYIYSAQSVESGKPAPDIFNFAAEKIGVSTDRCLVLEDSVNGVKAGVAAGMTVWGFVGGGHCFDGHDEMLLAAGASRVIPDFRTLTAAL